MQLFKRIVSDDQRQELVISTEANSREEAIGLAYDDFSVQLFLDGIFTADISSVFRNISVFTDLIDGINWDELYCESTVLENQ
ncbi:MAG: hypothetical protein GXC72_00710 [Chitinophagaceae bacterium]|nr:hypothetical protein [Chitinophagaceae bacterium]